MSESGGGAEPVGKETEEKGSEMKEAKPLTCVINRMNSH